VIPDRRESYAAAGNSYNQEDRWSIRLNRMLAAIWLIISRKIPGHATDIVVVGADVQADQSVLRRRVQVHLLDQETECLTSLYERADRDETDVPDLLCRVVLGPTAETAATAASRNGLVTRKDAEHGDPRR